MGIEENDYITVLWAGERRRAMVVKKYKNGKLRVQVARGRWTGGRPGTTSPDINVTVEPWQVVPEEQRSDGDEK